MSVVSFGSWNLIHRWVFSYSSVRWTVGWCLLALWRTWIISVAFMAGCMHRHLYSTVN